MSTTIDVAFTKQFEREVHEAYQRMGSKLRNTVRNVSNVVGKSTTFQKAGKGEASTKSRHGMVPVMNLDHTNVECLLQDFYAGDWVDKLDELKTNIDERQVIAHAGAYALGRKTDTLIVAGLDAVTGAQNIAAGGTGMTLTKIMAGMELLGNADVPDDGDRFAIVGWKQWSQLLQIDEFANSQWAGPEELPFKVGSSMGKKWLGTLWMPFSGLTLASTTRHCYWYHKSAIGHASGSDVKADITWHGDRAAHFINNMMSQGASLIDEKGIAQIDCTE